MLKKILSVSGKSGLYKLISQGKNMFIAESLIDGKRIPVYARDKVVSLGDIAIYTEAEEIPLAKVLSKIKEKEGGKEIDYNQSIQPDELRAYFETILPDFNKDRVYPSDIKKILSWYNLLVKSDLTDFEQEENPEEEKPEEEEKNETNEEIK
jgi:hypothetical protein